MLSDELVLFAQNQFKKFEAENLKDASRETAEAFQALKNVTLTSGLSEQDQLVNVLKQLNEFLVKINEAQNYVNEEREKLRKDKNLRDQYTEDSEVRANFPDHEENKEMREGVFENIITATAQAAKALGVKYHPDTLIEPVELIAALEHGDSNFRYKKISSFQILGGLNKNDASGLFSHETQRVQKAPKPDEVKREKHDAVWYAKYCENQELAGRELVAQEFYRLLMQWQPKTRIAIDDQFKLYILSKGSPDTQNMQDMPADVLREALVRGEIKGYGKISVANLFLNEVDAKSGNMLINNKTGEIIKIDGDWCLARLRGGDHAKDCDITAADIHTLPLVFDYQPYNWVDLYQEGTMNSEYKTNPEDNIISYTLPEAKRFRREVNQGLLNILILPKEFFETFVKSYIHDSKEVALLTKEFENRSTQARNAALSDPSFKKYMGSARAEKYMQKCIDAMLNFNTQGKNHLIKNPEEMRVKFLAEFQGIRSALAPRIVNSSQLIVSELQAAQKNNPIPPQFLRPKAPAQAAQPPVEPAKPAAVPAAPAPHAKDEKTKDTKDDFVFTRPRR